MPTPGLDALIALSTGGVTLAAGTLFGASPAAIGASAVAAATAIVAIMLARRAPVASFTVLFAMATLSRLAIELPPGRVRVEQPAILGVFLLLLLTSRLRAFRSAAALACAACFAAYLATLMVASVINAPVLATSARMLVWLTTSMVGAIVAFALLCGGEGGEQRALTAVGLVQALLGFGVGVAFLVLGPSGIPGIQISPGEVPKVASVDYEANLYASLLALLAPFALEEWRRHRRWPEALAALLILAALGLGVTRGAYAGLVAGVAVYIGVLALRHVPSGVLVRVAALAAVAFLAAPLTAVALLPTDRGGSGIAVSRPSVSPRPTDAGGSGAPSTSPGASRSPGATPTVAPTPTPVPTPSANTLNYRLDRIPTAVSDIRTSPIIGLGAASYGQRHPRIDAPDVPDYIGILGLTVLYESGIVGVLMLGLAFLILLTALAFGRSSEVGRRAAYAGAIVSFLVSYQATNALWFSLNWLIIGAAFALLASRADDRRSPETASLDDR